MQVPKLRRHKPSGQGSVRLNGRDHYLGRWPAGLREPPDHVQSEYRRLISEWIANDRHLPQPASSDGPSVAEVVLAYIRYADNLGGGDNIKQALRRLRELFGQRPAASIDVMDLEALQAKMVKEGLTRNGVNKDVGRIKRVFKWAASRKLVPVTTYQLLALAPGLRAGRSAAPETEPVKPVPVGFVDAVLPYAGRQVATMMQLERLTGMRPGEVVIMRSCDLETSGEVWLYRPESHKTAWRGKARVIALGPMAQELLRPWLRLNLTEYLFRPADATAERMRKLRKSRKSKVQPSQFDRRKPRPKKLPGDRYTTGSYGRAILYAIDQANRAKLCDRCKAAKVKPKAACPDCKAKFIPRWTPNQLRHLFATETRRRFGLEAAQVALGHSKADVTQVYAERDLELAAKVAQEVG